MTKRSVVVTGMGAVTPLGDFPGLFWENLLAGKSGVGKITLFDASSFQTQIAAEVKDFSLDKYGLDRRLKKRTDRFGQIALAAAGLAIEDAGLENLLKKDNELNSRTGVLLGVGMGGLGTVEEQHDYFRRRAERGDSSTTKPPFIGQIMSNAAPYLISNKFGLHGESSVSSSACASSQKAMGDSLRLIRHGYLDVVVTGGVEAIVTPLGIAGFNGAGALSTRNDSPERASRPFDRDRDGFVAGEGAGILIFEEESHARMRKANIYAKVCGYGATSDAGHMTDPEPEGTWAAEAIRLALKDARINPEQISYVNAHGTSTLLGDPAENKSLKKAFGKHARKIAISSTKSMVGHLIGAAAGVELIATVMSLKEGRIHPTINLDNQDPACDLFYVPNNTVERPIEYAMSNSFGFGGHNGTIVVGKL
jgi:3-oxoacyl-[acyl-carrier-protein] synthase II